MGISIEQIWVFELQDGFCGGFVFASSEEEARKKLALDRNTTVDAMRGYTCVFPITALDLNKDVHDIW